MKTVNGVRMKDDTIKRLGLQADDEPDAPSKKPAAHKARRASANKAQLLTSTGTPPEESGSDGNPAGER